MTEIYSLKTVFMKSLTRAAEAKGLSASALPDELLIQTFAKIDRSALGVAVGVLSGAGIFLATNFLIFKGGARVGATIALLNNYFFGYSVTFAGSVVGLIYGFVAGFILGWLVAFLRNFVIKIYLHIIKFKGRVASASNFLDD